MRIEATLSSTNFKKTYTFDTQRSHCSITGLTPDTTYSLLVQVVNQGTPTAHTFLFDGMFTTESRGKIFVHAEILYYL